MRNSFHLIPVLFGTLFLNTTGTADQPYAQHVVDFQPGNGGVPGFDNPEAALGPPTRTTGGTLFPGVVSPFQPAYLTTEIVSLGQGGQLVLAFDHDVLNDPGNPFGIDLIVFGNSFSTDLSSPNGVFGSVFSEGGEIDVSLNGEDWVTLTGLAADGPMPTLGWQDAGPYDSVPGLIPTDFTRPLHPDIHENSVVGLGYNELIDAYDGSGGGLGIDLEPFGLEAIRFIRFRNPSAMQSPEIDAVADVRSVGIPGDLDNDGLVRGTDVGLMLAAWATSNSAADLNSNGIVDGPDMGLLLAGWTP